MDDQLTQLHRHLAGLWRRRWLAVLVAWAICAAGWTVVALLPNSYEASARLYIDADAVLTPLLKGLALDNTLTTQIEILQRTLLSRPNLEKLISQTDLEHQVNTPVEQESLIAELGTTIRVVPETKNLFTIKYRNARPRLAYDVVRAVLNIFIESKAGTNRSEMDNATQFVSARIADYERQLREAEGRRADFRAKYFELLPTDGGAGVSKLEAARDGVRLLQGQLDDTTARLERLKHELTGAPQTAAPTTTPTKGANEAGTASKTAAKSSNRADAGEGMGGVSDLALAERQLQVMLLTMTDEHPAVIQQRKLMEYLRTSGGGHTAMSSPTGRGAGAANDAYARLQILLVETEADVDSLQRRVNEATKERDRLEDIARGAPGLQAQFLNLNRDYEVVRKSYDELLARREAMRLSAAADTDSDKVKLKVIDPPEVPQIPVSPKRLLLLSGVLVLGIAGGIGAVVLRNQFDRSFFSVRDLRALGLPVAGGISALPGAAQRAGRSILATSSLAVALLLLLGVYGALLYRVLNARGST